VNNSGLEAMKPPERRSFTYIKDRSGLNTVIFEILHNSKCWTITNKLGVFQIFRENILNRYLNLTL